MSDKGFFEMTKRLILNIDGIPRTVFADPEDSLAKVGAGGCGEIPLTSPHAAIINAIYHACGVRITELPARPEKVLAALKS